MTNEQLSVFLKTVESIRIGVKGIDGISRGLMEYEIVHAKNDELSLICKRHIEFLEQLGNFWDGLSTIENRAEHLHNKTNNCKK